MERKLSQLFWNSVLISSIMIAGVAGISSFFSILRFIFAELEVWTIMIVLAVPFLSLLVPLYAGLFEGNWTSIFFLTFTISFGLLVAYTIERIQTIEKPVVVSEPTKHIRTFSVLMAIFTWITWNLYYALSVVSIYLLHSLGESLVPGRDFSILSYLLPYTLGVGAAFGTGLAISIFSERIHSETRFFGGVLIFFWALDLVLAYNNVSQNGFETGFDFYLIHILRILTIIFVLSQDEPYRPIN